MCMSTYIHIHIAYTKILNKKLGKSEAECGPMSKRKCPGSNTPLNHWFGE